MALAGYQISHQVISPYTESPNLCRDRYGWFNVTFFHLWACSQCYTYLFPKQPQLTSALPKKAEELFSIEGTLIPTGTLLYPDLFQGSTIKDEALCTKLGQSDCQRLSSCCQAAIECCDTQLQPPPNQVQYRVVSEGATSCPRTWDGFACFQETPRGHVVEKGCPSYISAKSETGSIRKECTENGTWFVDPLSGKEWTDYRSCTSLKGYTAVYYVSTVCNIFSLFCLLPACIIFITFKQLRKQHRIRIHLNLFASFVLTNCVGLGWDHVIFRDRIENPQEGAIMHQRTDFCRVLYTLSRYTWTCNFVWMSIEGFHLYRLINHAFKTPKSIKSYYFMGWLAPCAPICLYAIVRVSVLDKTCWITHSGHMEWIMYGPNLLCILLNLAFLVNILRILLTQIQSHPNEPSNYRRALKATFILVPLFGLQLFLIVYRPQDISGQVPYEILAKLITNSQGAAVAIVFCFLNSEVHGQFRAHVGLTRTQHSCNEARSCTFSTDVRRTSARGNDRTEYIALNCAVPCHGSRSGGVNSCALNSAAHSVKWQPSNRNGHPPRGQIV